MKTTTWSKKVTAEVAGHGVVFYAGSGHGADGGRPTGAVRDRLGEVFPDAESGGWTYCWLPLPAMMSAGMIGANQLSAGPPRRD